VSDYPGQDIFHETITVLPDNAEPSAMNFALAVEGLTDRTTYLANRGSRGFYRQTSALTSGDPDEVYGAIGGSGTFVEFAASNGLVPYVDVFDCEVGDIVLVWCTGAFIQGGNGDANYAEIKLYATQDYGGSPPPAAAIAGAHARVDASIGGSLSIPLPITMHGAVLISTAGTCRVRLRGMNPDATGGDQSGYRTGVQNKTAGSYPLTLTAAVFRPTSTWGGA